MPWPWTKSSSGPEAATLDQIQDQLAEINARLVQLGTALAAAGLSLGPLTVVSHQRRPPTPPRIRTAQDITVMSRAERQRRQTEAVDAAAQSSSLAWKTSAPSLENPGGSTPKADSTASTIRNTPSPDDSPSA